MSNFGIEQMTGVITAMLTMFDENENVDIRGTEPFADFLLDRGVDGFYLTGSTGEGFLMSAEERNLVVKTVVDRVNGRKPVIAHVGAIGTKLSVELARGAWEAGADAISSVPPFYWKFSEDSILQYYTDLAAATPLPLIIYNIPLAGLMSGELVKRLAQIPNIRGLKFTSKDHDEMDHLKGELGRDFMIYSGSDQMAFSGMSIDADGVIGSFYNVMPETFSAILRCVRENDIGQGAYLQRAATEIILATVRYDYFGMMRRMLAWQGAEGCHSRRPFHNYIDKDPETVALREKLRQVRERFPTDAIRLYKYL